MADEEARAAATAVSENSAHKSVAAIRKEIAALERQCRSQLSQQRFLRASAPEQPSNKCALACSTLSQPHGISPVQLLLRRAQKETRCSTLITCFFLCCPSQNSGQPAEVLQQMFKCFDKAKVVSVSKSLTMACILPYVRLCYWARSSGGGDGPMMAEKVLPEPPAVAGSWRAGVRAATGLSAALGSWHSPLAESRPAGRPGQSAAASKPVYLTGDLARSAGQGAPPGNGSVFGLAWDSSAAEAAIDGSSAAAGAPHFAAQPPAAAKPQSADESMPDAAPGADGTEDQLGGRSAGEKGKQAAEEGSAAGAEEIVSPGRPTGAELERLRAEAHSRWLAQRERDRSADMTGPSRLAVRTGGSAAVFPEASLQQENGLPGNEGRGRKSVGLNEHSLQQGMRERARGRAAASAGGSLEQGRHPGAGLHDGGESPSATDFTEHVDLAGGTEDMREDEGDRNVCTVCYSAVEFAMVSFKKIRACLALLRGQTSRGWLILTEACFYCFEGGW